MVVRFANHAHRNVTTVQFTISVGLHRVVLHLISPILTQIGDFVVSTIVVSAHPQVSTSLNAGKYR